MKKILAFIFGLTVFFFQSKAQETSNFSNEASTIIKPKIEAEALEVCKKIKADYIGNITTKISIREDFTILVEGTVDYKSKNCNLVSADYRAIIKVVVDKSVKEGRILQVTCFYMKIPKCVEGLPIYYDKVYSVGGQDCK